MNAKELIQIKINVNKKAEAKVIGIDIAQRTNTELVQTLGIYLFLIYPTMYLFTLAVQGHSILLYRDINNGYIKSLLAKECSNLNE